MRSVTGYDRSYRLPSSASFSSVHFRCSAKGPEKTQRTEVVRVQSSYHPVFAAIEPPVKEIGNDVLHCLGFPGQSKAEPFSAFGVNATNLAEKKTVIASRYGLSVEHVKLDPTTPVIDFSRELAGLLDRKGQVTGDPKKPKAEDKAKSGAKSEKRERAPKDSRTYFYSVRFETVAADKKTINVVVRSVLPHGQLQDAFTKNYLTDAQIESFATDGGMIEVRRQYKRKNGQAIEGEPLRTDFQRKKPFFLFGLFGAKGDDSQMITEQIFTFYNATGKDLGSVSCRVQQKRSVQ